MHRRLFPLGTKCFTVFVRPYRSWRLPSRLFETVGLESRLYTAAGLSATLYGGECSGYNQNEGNLPLTLDVKVTDWSGVERTLWNC